MNGGESSMRATTEGVIVPWDELEELLRCIRDGMVYNDEHMTTNMRKRGNNRCEVIIELWKNDRNRCVRIGNALVTAYKEIHPEANVTYARVVD